MKKLLITFTILLLAIIPLYNYFEQNNDIQVTVKQDNKSLSAAPVTTEEVFHQSTPQELNPVNKTEGKLNPEIKPETELTNITSPADQAQNADISAAFPVRKTPQLNSPASVTEPASTPASTLIPVSDQEYIVTPEPELQPVSVDSSALQNEMLRYINTEREKANLVLLTLDKKLCEGASLKSSDMAVNDYFSHTSPSYGSPFEMMTSQGISYRSAAENIGKTTSIKEAHTAFMNSAGHEANILNPEYTKVGLGFYQKGQYLYVTQWFTD